MSPLTGCHTQTCEMRNEICGDQRTSQVFCHEHLISFCRREGMCCQRLQSITPTLHFSFLLYMMKRYRKSFFMHTVTPRRGNKVIFFSRAGREESKDTFKQKLHTPPVPLERRRDFFNVRTRSHCCRSSLQHAAMNLSKKRHFVGWLCNATTVTNATQ